MNTTISQVFVKTNSFIRLYPLSILLISLFLWIAGILCFVGSTVMSNQDTEVPPISSQQIVDGADEQKSTPSQIHVDVSGAVARPGVVVLREGSRVSDAIEEAQGFTQDADLAAVSQVINLAQLIEDGGKVYIPFIKDEGSSSPSSVDNTKMSINTASLAQLMSLKGIGEVRAQSIIDGRPYTSLSKLVENEILTETLFNSIKNDLML